MTAMPYPGELDKTLDEVRSMKQKCQWAIQNQISINSL